VGRQFVGVTWDELESLRVLNLRGREEGGKPLQASDLLVWLWIKRLYNPHPANDPDGPGYAWPGLKRLARETGFHRNTVRRSIVRLERFEMVRVIRVWGIGNQYHPWPCRCTACDAKERDKAERRAPSKVLEFDLTGA